MEEQTAVEFWDGNWREVVWPEVETIWDQEHPDIRTGAEFQADLASDKYMLTLINSTAPDMMACAPDWVTIFGSANLLEPPDEYVAKNSFDVSQSVQGVSGASTVGGKLYGLPFRNETYTMYYSRDILSVTGYDMPPVVWEEVKEVTTVCTSGDVYGYGLCGTNYSNPLFQYITILHSSGSDVLNADNSTLELGSSVVVEATQLYKDLVTYSPASLLENDNIANCTLFVNGKTAMYLGGTYDSEEIVKTNPDLNFACAMVPIANGAERSAVLGGWSVTVAECSKEKEAVWESVRSLTRSDIVAIYTLFPTYISEPTNIIL